jgi:hypothetical protein
VYIPAADEILPLSKPRISEKMLSNINSLTSKIKHTLSTAEKAFFFTSAQLNHFVDTTTELTLAGPLNVVTPVSAVTIGAYDGDTNIHDAKVSILNSKMSSSSTFMTGGLVQVDRTGARSNYFRHCAM